MNKILKKLVDIDEKPVPRKWEIIFSSMALVVLIAIWLLALFGGEKYSLFTGCENCEDCQAETAETAPIVKE